MAIFVPVAIIVAIIVIVVLAIVLSNKANNVYTNSQTISSQYYSAPSRHTSLNSSVDSINETDIMEYFANVRHGQKDNWFRFKYKKIGDEWRAYIIRMPPLNGRSGDLHMTHRYSDSDGNYWVCRDPKPTSLKDCMAVSKVWADRLCEYIATGIEANHQNW